MDFTEDKGRVTRVLIADDDTDVRSVIAHALQAHGYDVVEIASGPALLGAMVKHGMYSEPEDKPADVIISDIRMPGCSGFEVLADMRGRPWAPPVILITALRDPMIRQQAERLGAAAVMEKPVDVTYLRSVVDAVVRQAASDDSAGRAEL